MADITNCRLYIEGQDDEHSICHLLKRHDIDLKRLDPSQQFFETSGGDLPLLNDLPTIVKQSYQRIGIVIDTDINLTNRWQQIKDRLTKAGISPPESPDRYGTIIPGISSECRIGIWLMPNNEEPGNLEDFLKTLIPKDDCCWSFAQKATENAKSIGAGFSDTAEIKAKIHTWLAWQEKPGVPFGTALNAKYFEHDSPEALTFVAWFKKLFMDDKTMF